MPKEVMEGELSGPAESHASVLDFNMTQKRQSLIGGVVSRAHERVGTIANCYF